MSNAATSPESQIVGNGLQFQTLVQTLSRIATSKPYSLATAKAFGGIPPKRNIQRSVKRDGNGTVYMISVTYRGRTRLEVLNDLVDGIAVLNDLDNDTPTIRSFRHAAIAAVIAAFDDTEAVAS